MTWRASRRTWSPASAARSAAVVLLAGGVYLSLPFVGAKFTSTTANPSNSFASGTVLISDDDSGSAMFNVATMTTSASPAAECIAVSYTGTASAAVKLYASFTGDTGVLPYLTLKIEEGSGGSSSTCTGFVASSTLFNTTLNSWSATTYATGLSSWAPTGSASKTYRFTFTLSGSTPQLQQGSQIVATPTWAARAGT